MTVKVTFPADSQNVGIEVVTAPLDHRLEHCVAAQVERLIATQYSDLANAPELSASVQFRLAAANRT